jgi:hypothetical protein
LTGAQVSGILAMERPPESKVSAPLAYMESAPLPISTDLYTLSEWMAILTTRGAVL